MVSANLPTSLSLWGETGRFLRHPTQFHWPEARNPKSQVRNLQDETVLDATGSNANLGRGGMFDDIVERFARHKQQISPLIERKRLLWQLRCELQATTNPRVAKKIFRGLADARNESFHRVVGRVGDPDHLLERARRLAGGLREFVPLPVGHRGTLALGQVGQQRQPGQIGAQTIVQVFGNARPFVGG